MDLIGDKKKKNLIFNQLRLYISIGDRMRQLKKYDTAIYYYDMAQEAVEEEGEDIVPLIKRSKTYSALPNHPLARADGDVTMQKQPENPQVMENDATILYEDDQFEQALVRYHQGLRIRQKPDHFANGVLVATEAVEDCIGRHAGDILENSFLGDTVLKIWLNEQNLLQPFVVPIVRNPAREAKRLEHLQRYFGEKYLNRLYLDQLFLRSCVNNPQLYSGNLDTYSQLQNIVSDSLTKVDRRQTTLMRLRPLYTFKVKEFGLRMSQKMRERIQLRQKQDELDAAKLAAEKLGMAREAQLKHDTVTSIRIANRAKEFVRNQSNRLVCNKSVYINELHNIIGDLYLYMKEFIPHWTVEENDFRILYMLGIDVGTEEHLRGTFLPYIYDPRKLLEDSEKEMALAQTSLERSYLYHEMARSYGQLGKTETAHSMSRRCAQEARPAKSVAWTINGMFMVARFETMQKNYVDSKNTLNEAAEVSKTLKTTGTYDFLMRAQQLVDFVSGLEVEINFVLLKRKKDMLDSMPTRAMKMSLTNIFDSMNQMPPMRRMMLVPGVVSEIKKKKIKKKTTRPSMTVSIRGSVKDRRRANERNPDMVKSLDPRCRHKV